jgi:hypothetical protein
MVVTSMLALMVRDWLANGIAHSKNAQQARQHERFSYGKESMVYHRLLSRLWPSLG